MSDCAHTALTCANCQADVSHLATRIRTLEAALDEIASRTDWTRDDCGKAAYDALAHAATEEGK